MSKMSDMTSARSADMARTWQVLAIVYGIAVVINYPWELAQSGLFTPESNAGNVWLHCFVASLGDGVMVMLLYGLVRLASGRGDWFINPRLQDYVMLTVAGVLMAIAVEWIAVHMLQRWSYAQAMPVIPGAEVGLVPVLQMMLLPPLIFRIAAAVRGRRLR